MRSLLLIGFSCASWACSPQDDVAAVLLGDNAEPGDAGAGSDAGATDPTRLWGVVGQPLGSIRWMNPIAVWPLSASLGDFFGDGPRNAEPIQPKGSDASALNDLWRAVRRGEYGPRGNVVVVEDATAARYLLLFRTL